ncbi:hypothetical protein DB88DRAFT_219961 [Papiliotrema laurentii]|uniref:Uncharacterized protein n=1 Tax=Papiliotrema laurentii TaxID=5418 RepID=A0AAD9L7X5_PAPLA|nr:hypothetical protein DB88DRAFT_219961 [Papiliotrema laurentii]
MRSGGVISPSSPSPSTRWRSRVGVGWWFDIDAHPRPCPRVPLNLRLNPNRTTPARSLPATRPSLHPSFTTTTTITHLILPPHPPPIHPSRVAWPIPLRTLHASCRPTPAWNSQETTRNLTRTPTRLTRPQTPPLIRTRTPIPISTWTLCTISEKASGWI